MKCKDCECLHKGWFPSSPELYVCTGVKHPFVVENLDLECPEYLEKRDNKDESN